MSQRMTRGRKRQIEENIENLGIAVDDFGFTIDNFEPKSTKSKAKKNDTEESWDCNYVLDIKRQKRDNSPDSNPVYFRRILTHATIHQRDKSPTPPLISDDERVELELLEQDENVGQASLTQELLEIDENDDTASDTTEKLQQDLKDLLEETKELDVVQNGFSPVRPATPEEQQEESETPSSNSITNSVPSKITQDYDQIDLLSSESILECVDV